MVLQRVEGVIELDGRVDEPAWRAVRPLPMTQSGPLYDAPPSQRTVVRVAYDDRYLYVAGEFEAREPGDVRSRSLTRDRSGDGDRFEVVVDGYNDNENGVGFATNPDGIRIDFSVSRDGEGGSSANPAINTAWDSYWDVETSRDAGGWSVEMRIPLSTLRFQPDADGRVTMGLIVRRYLARENEHVTFPAIPERWAGGYQKPSLARDVVLDGVRSRRPVYVTPYALAGHGRRHDPASPGPTLTYVTEASQEVGLDVKYALADNLVLDLTANTDFAQAEADAFQVNLERFGLFFPEKRAFFLERAGVFDFQTRGDDRLFHSRTIGLAPDGQAVRILGGARLVGRIGEWDLGALDMQTAAEGGRPSENFGVARLRRRVLNSNTYVGAMVTTRASSASADLAYGADGQLHLGGSNYLAGSVAQAAKDGVATAASTAGLLSFERRSRVGLALSQTVSWTGEDYAPPVGFVSRRGILLHESGTGFLFAAPRESRLLRHGPDLGTVLVMRAGDRTAESLEIAPGWNIQWKSGLRVDLEANVHLEDVRQPFDLGASTIPAGRYWFRSARFFTALPQTWTLNSTFYFRYGQFYDGLWTLLVVRPRLQASEHLQLGLDLQRTRAEFPDREPFRADIVRLRAELALTRRLSGGALAQYSSTSAAAGVNARLRYNLGEGRDLYLVYNEGLNVADEIDAGLRPRSDERHLLIKFVYSVPFH